MLKRMQALCLLRASLKVWYFLDVGLRQLDEIKKIRYEKRFSKIISTVSKLEKLISCSRSCFECFKLLYVKIIYQQPDYTNKLYKSFEKKIDGFFGSHTISKSKSTNV